MMNMLLIFICSILFASPVKINVNIDREDYAPSEYLKITLDINIDKGYFIYSTNPEKSLSPTKIIWPDSTIFVDSTRLYEPAPKIKYDQNFEMDVSYHTDTIELYQYFMLSDTISLGINKVHGNVFYQVCDVKQCIRKRDEFVVDIDVKEGPSNQEYTTFPELKKDVENQPSNMLEEAVNSGLISFMILSFGMGLLALLTPCVFPMIPITVSYFTKQGEIENNNPLKSAVIYALGIIVIFTSLGLILAITLGASGANQIASNPWVNLFIALLFVFFAFSLFGMYEIQVPSAMRQFSLENENIGGTLGILFMALTFTLTSFTCTVQFVGLLLVAASQGSYLWPILGMIIFSTAFSLPFFFLALFPQYLSRLPQSGEWMNAIKVTMGFLELGAAMKFFSNVDLVWGIGFFTYNFVLASWVTISIIMGLYLLGLIRLPHDSSLTKIGVPRLVISIFFITFGLYLSNGLFGGKVYGLVDSYLPPKILVNEHSFKEKDKLIDEKIWLSNYQKAVEVSNEINKPIFIDFTGYTCTNCRWMEVNVFVNKEVQNLFENFVLTKLFTDGGPNHKEYQQMEIDRYGTSALPFYVVLDENETELHRFHGMDPDVNKFIEFLVESLERYNKK